MTDFSGYSFKDRNEKSSSGFSDVEDDRVKLYPEKW